MLGPNAAGKTTTIKLLAGLIKPTSGRARICGFDIQTQPLRSAPAAGLRARFSLSLRQTDGVGVLPFHRRDVPARCRAHPKNARELVTRFHLEEFADRTLEGLSHGTRQRIAIVSALLHDPEVFVIDEPMVGLDPQHARVVKDVLKERSRAGTTVLVSTHQLSIAEEMADRIGIILGGRLIAVGTREELRKKSGSSGALEEIFLALTAEAK